MKRSSGFSFMGFVALADMIFAVSAGLLLLNPLRLDDWDDGTDAAALPDAAGLAGALTEVERNVGEIETMSVEIARSAAVMMKDEKR